MNASVPRFDLRGELWKCLEQIPKGRVATFGDLATALGDVRAARWIATEMKQRFGSPEEFQCSEIPWHRLVRKTGQIDASDNERFEFQRSRLIEENCWDPTLERARIDLSWTGFETPCPLCTLAQWQEQVAVDAATNFPVDCPPIVAGIDISYRTPEIAVAAYVAVDVENRRVLEQWTLGAEASFPYITGYLTFRELPIYEQLLAAVSSRTRLAEVILVDGSGILHPRRSGIAVAVGVTQKKTTIGVAKHHLAGKTQPEPELTRGVAVWLHDLWSGVQWQLAVASPESNSVKRNLYISPGHRIDVASAEDIVHRVCWTARGPAPIDLADRLSRQVARKGSLELTQHLA